MLELYFLEMLQCACCLSCLLLSTHFTKLFIFSSLIGLQWQQVVLALLGFSPCSYRWIEDHYVLSFSNDENPDQVWFYLSPLLILFYYFFLWSTHKKFKRRNKVPTWGGEGSQWGSLILWWGKWGRVGIMWRRSLFFEPRRSWEEDCFNWKLKQRKLYINFPHWALRV
jgi:hypothetical protein